MVYNNTLQSSPWAQQNERCFLGIQGETYQMMNHTTHSVLFDVFMAGLEKRMGRDMRTDMGLEYKGLHLILENINKDLSDCALKRERRRFLLVVGFYLVVCFTATLKGNEAFMVEPQGLIQHASRGTKEGKGLEHVAVPLLGAFKEERGKRQYLILVTAETAS
eukprot:10227559-Ditylum_brightwellii.AAC.1